MGKYFGAPKRIFLQGADGYAADYDVLMKTAELLHKYVPSVESIGGYARIDNFYDKTEEQLRNMAAAGYSNPYIGVESGDDAVLKRINKGYTAAQAREVLEKIDASVLPFIVNFLNGAGGHEYGLANARRTAELYDGLHPTMIFNLPTRSRTGVHKRLSKFSVQWSESFFTMLSTGMPPSFAVRLVLKFFYVDDKAFVSAATDFSALIEGGNFKNNFASFNGNDFGFCANFHSERSRCRVIHVY